MNRALILIALFATACGGSPARNVGTTAAEAETVNLTDLPDGASISEAYRFALRPATAWSIAQENQLARFGDGAAAGAFHRDGGGFGVVFVESLPGTELERAAELIVEAFPPEGRALESQQAIRFRGYPALRQVLTGTVEGMPVRWTNIIFLHQDHLYRLTAWGAHLDEPGVQSFFDTFTLLEGPVVRPRREAAPDAMGVDWRVVDSRFESLAADLTVSASGEWHLMTGEELGRLNPDAAVGLVHSEPDIFAVVISEHVPETRQAAMANHLTEATAANLGRPSSGTRPLRFIDGEVQASVYRDGEFEYLHGVRCDGGQCRQLLIWYVLGSASAASEALVNMPSVEALTADSRETCRRTLATFHDERRTMGDGYAHRGDAYIDFLRGLTLRSPEGSYWEMSRGTPGEPESGADLLLFDRVHGIFGMFKVEVLPESGDALGYHHEVQTAIGLGSTTPEEIELGGSPGHESTGPMEVTFGTFEMHVFTTVIGNRGFRFAFWGWPEHMRASEASIDALISTATLHGGPIVPSRIDGERLIDERFGMAIHPPAGWEYNDFTAPAAQGVSVVHGFVYPDGSVVQLLAVRGQGEDEALLREEMVRSMIGRMRPIVGDAEPQRSTTTLAGREAATIRWRGGDIPLEMRVIALGRLVYGVVVIGRRDMAAIVGGFELLE